MRVKRRRYLALRVEADTERSFTKREVLDAVWLVVFQLFGTVGASELGLKRITRVNLPEDILLVRCWHDGLPRIWAAIAAVTEVAGTRAAVRVLAASGTLKGLRRKLTKQGVFGCE